MCVQQTEKKGIDLLNFDNILSVASHLCLNFILLIRFRFLSIQVDINVVLYNWKNLLNLVTEWTDITQKMLLTLWHWSPAWLLMDL